MDKLNFENQRSLEIINEKDEVIGIKKRLDVHRLGLLHREIHVWMFDKDYNIFFQRSGLHKPSAGRLDATVAGHVNENEDYLEAAVRETKEETGITVDPEDLVFVKKVRNTPVVSQEEHLATINNFIRTVYIYKHPIDETLIKKEEGIPGVGFQKISPDLLINIQNKSIVKILKNFILKNELPLVLKYINDIKKS